MTSTHMTAENESVAILSKSNLMPSGVQADLFLLPLGEMPYMDEDPIAFMADALVRSSWWIPQNRDILDVHNALRIVTDYRVAARSRSYPKEAQLDINEAERRFEYRVGGMILDGQNAGVFRKQGDGNAAKISLPSFLGIPKTQVKLLQEVGRISRHEFEDLLLRAREDGSLSRDNLLRLNKGLAPPEDRGEWNKGRRRIDSNKIMESLANELEAAQSGIDLVSSDELDPERKKECVDSIRASLRKINQEVSKW